jgi:hypothetical protein
MYILLFICIPALIISGLALYCHITRRYNGYALPEGDVYVNFV